MPQHVCRVDLGQDSSILFILSDLTTAKAWAQDVWRASEGLPTRPISVHFRAHQLPFAVWALLDPPEGMGKDFEWTELADAALPTDLDQAPLITVVVHERGLFCRAFRKDFIVAINSADIPFDPPPLDCSRRPYEGPAVVPYTGKE